MEKKYIIWTNNDYDKWCESMEKEGHSEGDMSPEAYYEMVEENLDNEKENLDMDSGGCIVAFADLGLWHGRVQGSRVVGENVKDIFKRFEGRFVTIFSDGKDVVCHDIHHDGTNEYIYRIAADRDEAEQLVYEVAYKGMDLEGFKSRTKSLHEAIKNVYGWD